jgi:hypothetical protein
VHRPGFYAQRFLDFMAKTVFKKIPSPLKHSPSKRKLQFPTRQRPISTGDNDVGDGFRDISSSNTNRIVKNPYPLNASHNKFRYTSEAVPSLRTVVIRQAASKQSVSIPEKSEIVSLSQIGFQNESENSVTSSCSSATSSGLGSTLRTVTWTPPHSIGTSTPTHTEGTPSITESSESGDITCPTTPIRSRSSTRYSRSSDCSDAGGDNANDVEMH